MNGKHLLCVLMALVLLCGCAAAPMETTVHVHDYEAQIQKPTCLEGGFTRYECACGDHYTADVTSATGHQYTETVVLPTWEEDGYTKHICVCGDSFEDSFVECDKYATQPLSVSKQVLHFFDDAAFIGDSIMCKLQRYHMEHGTFGSAVFFAAVSYSVRHAVDNTMYLMYRGKNMTPQDALAACGAKKVFIMLGMNDVGILGVDKSLDYWAIMVQRIREKNPDIQIYIQSCTPVYIPAQTQKINNEKMDAYNARLIEFAKENDCHYIDIATPMKNDEGGLKEEFCHDFYVHVNLDACDVWAQALKDYIMQ